MFNKLRKKARNMIRKAMGENMSDERPALRDNNYHFRFTVYNTIESRGGTTIIYRVLQNDANGFKAELGCAVCSPSDNYCKRIGRLRAQGRIVHTWTYAAGQAPTYAEVRAKAIEIAGGATFKIINRLYNNLRLRTPEYQFYVSHLSLVTRNREPVAVSL